MVKYSTWGFLFHHFRSQQECTYFKCISKRHIHISMMGEKSFWQRFYQQKLLVKLYESRWNHRRHFTEAFSFHLFISVVFFFFAALQKFISFFSFLSIAFLLFATITNMNVKLLINSQAIYEQRVQNVLNNEILCSEKSRKKKIERRLKGYKFSIIHCRYFQWIRICCPYGRFVDYAVRLFGMPK